MWPIFELETLGLDFEPKYNAFTYTFPPPYFAKRSGEVRRPDSFSYANEWPDVSLYLHIPFCQVDCSFCSLHRQVARDDNLVECYLSALRKEILSLKKIFPNVPVMAIYFGGGTPSILSPERIGCLLDSIEANFNLQDSVEVCIECAPSTHRSNREWHSFLRKLTSRQSLPLNRISFGIQSFDEKTLHSMGRHGGMSAVMDLLHAVDDLVFSYNIDVILGYPEQASGFSATLATDKILASIASLFNKRFRIPSISLYQLWDTDTIRITQNLKLPEKETLLTAKWRLQKGLFELGYKPCVVSTVVRSEEFEHLWIKHRHLSFRHVGMGSGVYSIFPRELVHRPRNIENYIHRMETASNTHELDVCYNLSEEEIFIRQIIMGLRSYEWIATPCENHQQYMIDELKEIMEKIGKLINFGLLERRGNLIRLTNEAFMIANEISSYLHPKSHPRKLMYEIC
ncbi:radical SAM protein [Candidatus Poribacteria bacterium]|nr:radical SAM protein [Candidatus Poribacteria bacterium]